MLEQIGRYKILSELGRGAMGVVYKAQDTTIGRLVAVKTIRMGELAHPEERDQLRSRLFREAQSAGILSHPGIVTIYDIAEEADLAYITMEFVEGHTLERLLDQGDLNDAKYLISVATQTALALDYAHGKGIVHRDIKPGNIMVTTEGQVKITDFGIARIASSKFTHTGTVMGTPSYMSPEQVRGAVVDGRSDLFSLAVVLYEMLTGQKPFSGDSITTVIFKIVSESPLPPKDLNPSVGNKVNTVVMRALAKEPADRYQSCKEFAESLQLAVAQTANLTPTVKNVLSTYDATAASEAALLTQPDRPGSAKWVPPPSPWPPPAVEPTQKLPPLEAKAEPVRESIPGPSPPAAVEPTHKKLPPLEAKAEPVRKSAPPVAGPPSVGPAPKRLPSLEGKHASVGESAPVPSAPPPMVEPAPQKLPPLGAKPAAGRDSATVPAPSPIPLAGQPAKPATPRRRTGLLAGVTVLLCLAGAGIFWQMTHQPGGPAALPVKPGATPTSTPSEAVQPPPAPVEKAAVSAALPSSPEAKPAGETKIAPKAGAAERAINVTTTEPGARVVVDGNEATACTTPCSIPVSAGRHNLVLNKPGYHPEVRDLTLAREPVDVQVVLRAILGTVMLSTAPAGASITVDGQAVEGATPKSLKLPLGKHVIAVTKEGFGAAQQDVEVTEDALLPVRIILPQP